MRDRPLRLECPVCLGVKLSSTRISDDSQMEIDHCTRCGGVWLERDEAAQLRARGRESLWARVTRRGASHRMPCRGCDGRIHRDDEACRACGWKNVLICPACDHAMTHEGRTGLALDICVRCRGVWFDNHELELIWTAVAATGAAQIAHQEGAFDGFADTMSKLDNVHVAGNLAVDGVRVASAVADASGGLPDAAGGFEAAVSLVEAVGGVAQSAFEVVCGVVELVFGVLEGF